MYNTGVSITDPFVQNVIAVAGRLGDICLIIVLLLSFIPLTQAALNVLFKGEDGFDWSPIWNLLVVCFLLKFYNEVMTIVSAGIGGATEMLAGVLVTKSTVSVTTDQGTGGITNMSMWDFFTTESTSTMRSIFVWLSAGAISIAKTFIDRFRLLVLSIIYLIGPIALMISTIPGKKDSSRIWFNAYFFVQCIAITILISDMVYVSYNNFHKQDHPQTDDFFMFVIMQLCFVAVYLLAGLFTSFYLGFNVAGAAITKVVSMATTVATIAKNSFQNAGKTTSAATSVILNAPTMAVNAMQSARDFKDKVSMNHALAKQIIKDPKGTFGFKNHEAGI